MTIKNFYIPTPTHETPVVDGVLRWPLAGINVVVAGGGPCGYLAGLECWRKGHNVTVFEKNTQNSTIGEVLFIGPSALCTLKYYPSMLKEYEPYLWDNYWSFRRLDGSQIIPSLGRRHGLGVLVRDHYERRDEIEKEKQGIHTPELKLNEDWGIH